MNGEAFYSNPKSTTDYSSGGRGEGESKEEEEEEQEKKKKKEECFCSVIHLLTPTGFSAIVREMQHISFRHMHT